jgi:hypothetical protein
MKVAAGLGRWRKKTGRGTPTLPGLDTTESADAGAATDALRNAKLGREDPRMGELRVKMRAARALREKEVAENPDAPPPQKARATLQLGLKKEMMAKERFPGARGSIFGEWHKQHSSHQTNPLLKNPKVMDYLGDPDHAYCILHKHDRIAEKKRREKHQAAREVQRLGRKWHHEEDNHLVKRGGGATILAHEDQALREKYLEEKEVTHERLAKPWPKPPPTPEPLLRGSTKAALTTGEKLFLAEEAERIRKRHQFDIYVMQLDELQIALGLWNSLTQDCAVHVNPSRRSEVCKGACCHEWYEAEARRRDAQTLRLDECKGLVSRLFKFFDKDGGGFIDRNEMLKLIEAVAVVEVELTQLALGMSAEDARTIAGEQLAPEKIAETFFTVMAKIDKDDDEEITKDELLTYFLSIEENECALESPFFEIKVLDPLRELGDRTFARRSKEAKYGLHGMILAD